jgi:hypothetical protein
MKKSVLFLAGLFFLLLSMGTNAQTQPATDYFADKWDLLIIGTPNGDSHSTLTLIRVDGKLSGDLKTPSDPIVKLTKVDETAEELTIYFTSSSGYDVYFTLKKKDDTHAEGSMMDMFECKASRIIETDKN